MWHETNVEPVKRPYKLLERQYQLQAQRRHEEHLKQEYYRQTARYFERETILAKQFSSWCSQSTESYNERIKKAQRAEKLRVRREKLRQLFSQEEETYERQLEELKKQKRPSSREQLSLEELRRKLLEKRAEQSLYYPSQCRRLRSYQFSPTDTAKRLEPLDVTRSNGDIATVNKYSHKPSRHSTSPSIERILFQSKYANDLTPENSKSSISSAAAAAAAAAAKSLKMSSSDESVESVRSAAVRNARRSQQSLLETNIRDEVSNPLVGDAEGHGNMKCSADSIGDHHWDKEKRDHHLKVSGWTHDDEEAYEEACSRLEAEHENSASQSEPEHENSASQSEPEHENISSQTAGGTLDETDFRRSPVLEPRKEKEASDEVLQDECEPPSAYVPHTDNDVGPDCHRRGHNQHREADCAGTGDISVQMYRYLKHNDLKRKILELCQREHIFVVKQCWDEALRLREMRNELILLKSKNLYENHDLKIDDETRRAGIGFIEAREELLKKRGKVCNTSIYSDEAKDLWKQWVHEDDEISKLETNEMRDLHLKELESEWKNLALCDKNRISQLYDRVMSKSDLQDEQKLAAIIQGANDRQKQYMNYIAT